MPTQKFFITHSWKDLEFAKRLTDDLRKHGLDGFLDAYSIKPGDVFSKEIQRGLEACDIYVPILSCAALASPWCEEEINAAITLSKMPGRAGRPRIIPVLVENCQNQLPIFLYSRLYIIFENRYEDALRDLLTQGFETPMESVAPKPSQTLIIRRPSPKIETHSRTLSRTDGKEMILIPAGTFMMGEGIEEQEENVEAFYIDRYPVTNAEYKKFIEATKHRTPGHWQDGRISRGRENHPIINVSWNDAMAYARWAGKRLPTEAEWEKAASWDAAHQKKRQYPWGDEFEADRCNTRESGIGYTTPVGKFSPQGDSAYGVGDMAGNVWEWCEDRDKDAPSQNLQASDSKYHILRGGSWSDNYRNARCAYRFRLVPNNLSYIVVSVGFRLCASSDAVLTTDD